ncbi:type II toxin-antitoxin system VapC family toxin [Amycolatopsis alkalitolerans]|uniref:Ribonuclease VapC n=1 Tax=Amycolatopsis alkalitolerans TaxID=2547244 RepID=A0A5C4M4T1_9PSEU|nr:type II toxin-antitoxin system VapC family toxin [Amycolatopsis alkalitolerans]TNC26425.1 type II toxin-antitoxin system VapC family toxin [Amycolatopsis alkalitolerans]
MIVVDASAFGFALLDEGPFGDQCRDLLAEDDRWIAPEHWMVEVLSIIRGNLLGGKIAEEHAAEATDGLARLQVTVPLTRILLPRMWELRNNLSTYDAAYVAAAEVYGCRLLTADERLARAPGITCPVAVLG